MTTTKPSNSTSALTKRDALSRPMQILSMLGKRARYGATAHETCRYLGIHHGSASGTLSRLHATGAAARLVDKRDGQSVYVLTEYVEGRKTIPYGQRKKPSLLLACEVGDDSLGRLASFTDVDEHDYDTTILGFTQSRVLVTASDSEKHTIEATTLLLVLNPDTLEPDWVALRWDALLRFPTQQGATD